MAIFAFHELPRSLALRTLINQRSYSPGQVDIAKTHRHFFWVEARPAIRKRISRHLRRLIFERDGGQCRYCSCYLFADNFTLDHIKPVVRGGDDSPENLCLACRPCNSRKGADWDG